MGFLDGITARRQKTSPPAPVDVPAAAELEATLTAGERTILERVGPLTMTSPQRVLALVDSVKYIVRHGLRGDLAECGVWRGGSVLAMILTLQELGTADRDIHLYDTFEGMTEPTELDTSPFDGSAIDSWRQAEADHRRPWQDMFGPEVFDEASVRTALLASGYPEERLHFHRGDVLQTIPTDAPDHLALLRLDTDWYESTRHELEHLYPRLVSGGVLLIDDYGHWEGARRAVTEYFGERAPLLSRVDYTARVAVKP